MVSVEHRLLLNAVERQKHTATIRLLGVASTPSPLPPSSLSPLPTTLEDTGLASLLFKRSSNWFAEPSHMTEPYLSMEDITAPRGSHMTTVETKQSDYITTSEPVEESTDHMTTVELSHDGPAVRGGEEEEEEEVGQARTELVRLQMDKRRLEARHRRLGRKLMETRTKKSQLQTVETIHSLLIYIVPFHVSLSLSRCLLLEGVSEWEAPPTPGGAVCSSAAVRRAGGRGETEGAGRSPGLSPAPSQGDHSGGAPGPQPPAHRCSTPVQDTPGRYDIVVSTTPHPLRDVHLVW